jgi:D-serine deaminase-like pyridoxal phosphate-dependent protein
VELRGFFTYPSGSSTADLVGETAELFLAGGLPVHTVSGGGTPTMWDETACAGLTEYRAGTYVFFDRNSIGAGVAAIDDCALRVLTTVVSRPTATRAVLDAGSKTLTSDLWLTAPDGQRETFGLIVDAPGAVIYAQSEEHGHVDLSACAERPAIGDRLSVIPNHCCVTTNLHDTVFGVRDGVVEQAFTVAARGKVL